jgi:hypothetical protein
MARREYTFTKRCTHEGGCPEAGFYAYDTRREQGEAMVRYRKEGWLCSRHSRPDEVLSIESPVVEAVLESYETDFGTDPSSRTYKRHRFWTTPERVAEKKGGNGFSYGPGFKAFAKDFPVGTRLTVTARVELPPASRDSQAPNGDPS